MRNTYQLLNPILTLHKVSVHLIAHSIKGLETVNSRSPFDNNTIGLNAQLDSTFNAANVDRNIDRSVDTSPIVAVDKHSMGLTTIDKNEALIADKPKENSKDIPIDLSVQRGRPLQSSTSRYPRVPIDDHSWFSCAESLRWGPVMSMIGSNTSSIYRSVIIGMN